MPDVLPKENATPQREVEPIPPRFWWLRRILIGSCLILIVLTGIRVWWGWNAHRRLQAEIDRIIETGEPIYPADFDPPEIRPEDNAAKLLTDAVAALNLTPEQHDLIRRISGDFDAIRKNLDEVELMVRASEQSFHLVHRTHELAKIDWGIRVRSPAINVMFGNLSGHRQVVKLLSIVAIYHSAHGADARTLETLLDVQRYAEILDDQPFLIGHLVSLACRARVFRDLEYLAPRVALTPGENDPMVSSATSRKLAERLLARLLDETGFHRSHIRAMQSERMSTLDTAMLVHRRQMSLASVGWTAPMAPTWIEKMLSFPLAPLYELDAVRGLRHMTAIIDAVREPDWPAAKAAFPPSVNDWSPLERLTRPISGIMLPSLDRAVLLHYRAVAETRMAAITLAIRLYETDHGRRPNELEHLVPRYLPAVPPDPFAKDARPIGYKPNAPKPLLYSVGRDGVDDHGAFAFRGRGSINLEKLDMPFFLDGYRPTKERPSDIDEETSTESKDHGDDVSGDRGNAEEDEPGEH